MTATLTRPDSRELLLAEGADTRILRECRNQRVSLSTKLEMVDPSDQYAADDRLGKLDAFERQLYHLNIRTRADMRLGLPASTIAEFMDPVKPSGERFFASDTPQSWLLYPEYINRQIRILPLPMDVLDALVAQVTPIDSDNYKATYLNDNVQTAPGQINRQMVRVDEGAEIPPAYISTYENNARLHKYGIRLVGSYETFRRLRVDLFTIFLGRIAMQTKLDLATHAINVIVNGDGNGNSATNYNASSLDPLAAAGPGTVTDFVTGQTSSITKKLTYQAWSLWRATLYPLAINTVVGRVNEIFQVLSIQYPNLDPMMLLALLQQSSQRTPTGALSMQVNLWGQDINLVYHPWAPGGILTGLDKRFAVEQLVEQNSSMTETDRDVIHQLNDIVVSQVVGFAKILPTGASTLTFV